MGTISRTATAGSGTSRLKNKWRTAV